MTEGSDLILWVGGKSRMNSLGLIAAQNSGVNVAEDISAGVDHLNNLLARRVTVLHRALVSRSGSRVMDEECLEH